MSVLEHDVTLIGSKGRVRCRALFDSGAGYSIIRRDIAERIEPLGLLPNPARFSDEFIVFDECSEEVIVGAKTLQAWHIVLDFNTETVIYRKTARRLRV